MSMPPQSRRDFLASITAAGAVSLVAPRGLDARTARRSIGANDRIRIGIIGCGNRGIGTEMASVRDHAKDENLEVIAVYDPWRVAREDAAAKAKEWFGTDAQAVQERGRTARARRRGRGVHLLTRSLARHPPRSGDRGGQARVRREADGDRHRRAEPRVHAAKASGVVIQVGTQLRSTPVAMGCRELVKSGRLGRTLPYRAGAQRRRAVLVRVPQARCPRQRISTGTRSRTAARKRAFDPILYSGWYGYWEFSQGPVPQWGVHFLDRRTSSPASASRDLRVPGRRLHVEGRARASPRRTRCRLSGSYPEGLMISYSTNFGNSAGNVTRFCGDKGTLRLDWSDATFTAEGGIHRDGSIRGENKVEPIEQTDHWVNWYRCMRDGRRRTPRSTRATSTRSRASWRRCCTRRAAARGSTPRSAPSPSTDAGLCGVAEPVQFTAKNSGALAVAPTITAVGADHLPKPIGAELEDQRHLFSHAHGHTANGTLASA